MRSNGEMRFLRISTGLQLKVAMALLLIVGVWLTVAGATVLLRMQIEDNRAALGARAAMAEKSEGRAAALRSSVDGIADRLETRQQRLDTLVERYFGSVAKDNKITAKSASNIDAGDRLSMIEQQQIEFVGTLDAAAKQRSQDAATTLRRLGINPGIATRGRNVGMGGPFVPVSDSEAALARLSQSLAQLDTVERTMLAVPATLPAQPVALSSPFGVRSDPFNGAAAMHTGLDIRGSFGQPIYAAAPGRVVRVGPWSGYGNVVVIDHGHGIETRYGHLSGFNIRQGAIVKSGQQIARMGSTGRSTGNHLHFEVRINGRAVNPRPFLEASRDVLEIQARVGQRFAVSQRS